jgi:hypothetical protein
MRPAQQGRSDEERVMTRNWILQLAGVVCAGLSLAGCTSDPAAPVNQAFPIRQMDQFFGSLSAPPAPQVDYRMQPGYAPAYPEYSPQMTAGRPLDAGTME